MSGYYCPVCPQEFTSREVTARVHNLAGHLRKHVTQRKITEQEFLELMLKELGRYLKEEKR